MGLSALLWMQADFGEWSWRDYWQSFGPLNQWLLLIMFAMLVVAIARGARLYVRHEYVRRAAGSFVRQVNPPLACGDLATAAEVAAGFRGVHLARITSAGLTAFLEAPRESAVALSLRSMQRARALMQRELRHGLDTLALIANLSPYFGLLGTTIGILDSFKGSGSRATVIAGILWNLSLALIPTALGLLVAILAAWIHSHATERVEVFEAEMENAMSEMVGYLCQREAPGEFQAISDDMPLLTANSGGSERWEARYEQQLAIFATYLALMVYFGSLCLRYALY